MITITKDPQKSIIYREQFEVVRPLGNEELTESAIRSITEALWERRASPRLRCPEIKFTDEGRNVYLPDFHRIMLSERFATTLLHELAHAVVAAIGRTLFTEDHGPLFCYEYGMLWSEYTTSDFEIWKKRWEDVGIKVSSSRPNFEDERWALPKRRNVAVRPATDAIRSELEIQEIFTSIRSHPLA